MASLHPLHASDQNSLLLVAAERFLAPLAAPVLLSSSDSGINGGGGTPSYSSVVLVRKDGPFRSFSDLGGTAVFAFNDANSLSGYHCMRFHLASQGLGSRQGAGWFRAAVETGGHQKSLECLLSGTADVAAIDQSVLAKLRKDRLWRMKLSALVPLADLKTLGPYPGQPFVAPKSLGPRVLKELGEALVSSPPSSLAPLGWQKIVAVGPQDYDCIRTQLKACAGLEPLLCPPGMTQSLDRARGARGGGGGADCDDEPRPLRERNDRKRRADSDTPLSGNVQKR